MKPSDNSFDSCYASHKYKSDYVQRSTILYKYVHENEIIFLRSVISFEFSFSASFSSFQFLVPDISSPTFFDSFVIFFS